MGTGLRKKHVTIYLLDIIIKRAPDELNTEPFGRIWFNDKEGKVLFQGGGLFDTFAGVDEVRSNPENKVGIMNMLVPENTFIFRQWKVVYMR